MYPGGGARRWYKLRSSRRKRTSASKGGPRRRGAQRWHKKDELDDEKEEQERKKRNQDEERLLSCRIRESTEHRVTRHDSLFSRESVAEVAPNMASNLYKSLNVGRTSFINQQCSRNL